MTKTIFSSISAPRLHQNLIALDQRHTSQLPGLQLPQHWQQMRCHTTLGFVTHLGDHLEQTFFALITLCLVRRTKSLVEEWQ